GPGGVRATDVAIGSVGEPAVRAAQRVGVLSYGAEILRVSVEQIGVMLLVVNPKVIIVQRRAVGLERERRRRGFATREVYGWRGGVTEPAHAVERRRVGQGLVSPL